MNDFRKLDLEQVELIFRDQRKQKGGTARLRQEMNSLRTAVHAMVGGGWLGSSAANQPNGFYIDDRVGKLPYSRRQILQAVEVLCIYMKVLKYTNETLPRLPSFHNCGVF
jgi:hypothetical protein